MRRIASVSGLILWFSLAGFSQGWTASIIEKPERLGFEIRCVVSYQKTGQQSMTREYRFDGSDVHGQLQTAIKSQIDKLINIDVAISAIGVGPFIFDVPTVPTQEQIDQQNFLVLLKDWQTKKTILEQSVKTGVATTVKQGDVDNALAAWKAIYKDIYAPFIVGLF